MSEPYYPNAAGADTRTEYFYDGDDYMENDDFDSSGGGGGGGTVLGSLGKGDRVMYRPGMDLGPMKGNGATQGEKMYGDKSKMMKNMKPKKRSSSGSTTNYYDNDRRSSGRNEVSSSSTSSTDTPQT